MLTSTGMAARDYWYAEAAARPSLLAVGRSISVVKRTAVPTTRTAVVAVQLYSNNAGYVPYSCTVGPTSTRLLVPVGRFLLPRATAVQL